MSSLSNVGFKSLLPFGFSGSRCNEFFTGEQERVEGSLKKPAVRLLKMMAVVELNFSSRLGKLTFITALCKLNLK